MNFMSRAFGLASSLHNSRPVPGTTHPSIAPEGSRPRVVPSPVLTRSIAAASILACASPLVATTPHASSVFPSMQVMTIHSSAHVHKSVQNIQTSSQIKINYTNWRGEVADRLISPKSIRWGSTEWHPEKQWLINAEDVEKKVDREFALKDIILKDPSEHLILTETETVQIRYTNWRGETADRQIIPQSIYWGSTEWHPEEQWLLRAKDIEKGASRDFALKDVASWKVI